MAGVGLEVTAGKRTQGLLPRRPAVARFLQPAERQWLQGRQDALDAKAEAADSRSGRWWVRAPLWVNVRRGAKWANGLRQCASLPHPPHSNWKAECRALMAITGWGLDWELWYLSPSQQDRDLLCTKCKRGCTSAGVHIQVEAVVPVPTPALTIIQYAQSGNAAAPAQGCAFK